ncbi:MAG: peptidase [Chlorobi bacterium]|nr:peptidase [Chlorobiota bacterium]
MQDRDFDRTISHTGGVEYPTMVAPPPRRKDRYWLHILLFILTCISTMYAGMLFSTATDASITSLGDILANLYRGLPFSALLMLFISAHEFGHYFAARAHNVDATLPFYIPMPISLFGTMGAVIRTRTVVPSRRAMFDIGVAGPIAGFVVALAYLIIGMLTMPGIESLYAIHPEYRALATLPAEGTRFGGFLLFGILKKLLIAPGRFFPGMNEIYHYPLLSVGWFGMFVTALNMIPVGQLDGGHVIYGMFGRAQRKISRWFVGFLVFSGFGTLCTLLRDLIREHHQGRFFDLLGVLLGPPLEWLTRHAGWWMRGWLGWLLWVVIILVVIKIPHPPVPDETPLDRKRIIIGWCALGILVLTFTFTGVFELVR